MFRLFSRIVEFSFKKERLTEDDQRNLDTFVTSSLCKTIEKGLRNRIAERGEIALAHAGELEAKLAKARISELADILEEWKNLRDDLSK